MCVAVLTLTQPLQAAVEVDGLFGTPSKYKNLFVFKGDKNLEGAKVEVLSENGAVITTQTMQKRKLIIDFCDVREGIYTIRVSKGNRVKEFYYNKQ